MNDCPECAKLRKPIMRIDSAAILVEHVCDRCGYIRYRPLDDPPPAKTCPWCGHDQTHEKNNTRHLLRCLAVANDRIGELEMQIEGMIKAKEARSEAG